MPKSQINTKSSSYQRDKETFLKDVKDFNHSKNFPYKIPTVNGIEIDLYHFYSLVQQKGGFSKTNQNDSWDSFLRPLHLPHPCVNGSTLLKRIYSMYLEKYERAKGPPGRDDDNDLDEDPRRGSRGGIPRLTFSGGTYISASGEALRTGPSRVAGPTERLTLSLLSPMPNEHDFAINVCTILAADTSNKIPLFSCPHILDLLLAHGGVYNHSSLRDTIGRSYFECRGRYPDDFWRLRAGGGGAKELADETKFMQPGLEQPELIVQALAAHNTLTDCLESTGGEDEVLDKIRGEEEFLEDWVTEPSEEDQLFAPQLAGGAGDVYTQRILQIASIMRSLSFHDENVHILAKNNTLIRFLLLCANCWNGTLRQAGLDTLGNISTELIIKDPATCLISRHVLSTIQSSLVSPDRARVLAALELLNKLAQNEANEDALLRVLEAKVYADVCSLLTLRDIMVLVCTLECVYALTSLGDRASEACARVPGLLHTLVSLVTVEAQSYGPKACILMRVVETVSGPSAIAAAEQQQQQQQQQAQQQQQQAQQQPQQQQQQQQQQAQQQTQQPQQQSQTAAKASTEQSATAPAAPPTTPMSNIQQSHLQQRTVQENEHFALAWLRSSFEALPPHDNSAVDVVEVYKQYLGVCQKLSRKGVIAPAHFPRLVRTAFGGTVGPTTVNLDNGETRQAFIGIKSKPVVLKVTNVGPASPILKAQLTNKPTVEVKPSVVTSQSQPQAQTPQPSNTHPHLSQALESTPSNTSLIKHLLAHKVSPAPVAQVAQRQQNQQMRASNNAAQSTSGTAQAMEVDPEALIKCTTIMTGGVASSTPAQEEKVVVTTPQETVVPKEEPMQIQIDEQAQLTIKTAQNKMLADLLEKKSNPPVQVVQMTPQINAPTIQITETGQIVQVKSESGPVIQINDPNVMSQPGQYFQIKNEQGQIIHFKNEHGQIIQLKSEQLQAPLLSFKNEQGQIVQIKTEPVIQGGQVIQAGQMLQQGGQMIQQGGQVIQQTGQVIQAGQVLQQGGQVIHQGGQMIQQGGQMIQQGVIQNIVKVEKEVVDAVNTDHSYTEPPNKKQKIEDKRESTSPHEIVSKTAANLYAALAASALEDEDDLIPEQKPVEVVHPQQHLTNDNASASVIIQEPILQVQQPTMQVQQQTLQIQQPTLQVQAPTLQVQQPMLQVQPMDVQNIIASQSGQIILQDKPIMTQQTQFVQQPMQIIATQGASQAGLNYLTQNIPGNMMQKTIIIVQGPTGGGPLTLTVNNAGGLDESTLNSLITQATEAITQQQIIQNSGVIQSAQRVIVSQAALVSTSQPITVVKTAIAQKPLTPVKRLVIRRPGFVTTSRLKPIKIVKLRTGLAKSSSQITPSQQPIITAQPQPHKAQIVNQSQTQQIVVTQKQPPALISSSGNQVVSGNQQIMQGNQQIIAVSNTQQMVVKPSAHRTVTQRQVVCMQPNASPNDTKSTVIQTSATQRQVVSVQPTPSKDGKTAVIQATTTKTQQQVVRQVISRQPVMVGNNKIGDKEIVVTQPAPPPPAITEKPSTPKPTATTPLQPKPEPQPATQTQSSQDDTPWICHWRACGKVFESAADVFTHAAKIHCPPSAVGEAPCLWLDCDRVSRKTFALLNHLTDKHCTPNALKAVYNTRRHIAAESEPNKPVALGYPPNAALAALNKHANESFNPRELMDENEGPVTKSIRLTAALILRNIVIYSNTGRRQLRSYEAHLATIALSTVEASRTIAQVLYDMNNI